MTKKEIKNHWAYKTSHTYLSMDQIIKIINIVEQKENKINNTRTLSILSENGIWRNEIITYTNEKEMFIQISNVLSKHWNENGNVIIEIDLRNE